MTPKEMIPVKSCECLIFSGWQEQPSRERSPILLYPIQSILTASKCNDTYSVLTHIYGSHIHLQRQSDVRIVKKLEDVLLTRPLR